MVFGQTASLMIIALNLCFRMFESRASLEVLLVMLSPWMDIISLDESKSMDQTAHKFIFVRAFKFPGASAKFLDKKKNKQKNWKQFWSEAQKDTEKKSFVQSTQNSLPLAKLYLYTRWNNLHHCIHQMMWFLPFSASNFAFQFSFFLSLFPSSLHSFHLMC